MREYIRNMNKTNDLILDGTLGNDEINRFSRADYRWADNKTKSFQTRKIKKGEIYISLNLEKTLFQRCRMSIGA